MITIELYKDKDFIRGFKAYGHAGYDQYGKDIVCAAVSILTQTTLNSLFEVLHLDEKNITYTIDNDGMLEVNLSKNISDLKKKEINIVMQTLEVGIKSLIDDYSEYVTLKCREV